MTKVYVVVEEELIKYDSYARWKPTGFKKVFSKQEDAQDYCSQENNNSMYLSYEYSEHEVE